MRKFPVVCTAVSVLAVAGLVATWLLEDNTYRRALIYTASTAYVLIAISAGGWKDAYGRHVLVALVFCWLGDIFGPGNFLLGVVMFFIAHLAFIPGFVIRGVTRRSLLAGLTAAIVVTAVITVYLSSKIPYGERPFIYAYAVVIALMLGFAIATFGTGSRGLIPLAALLFYVSDLFLAQTAFLSGGRIWTVTGYPMYYTACILFAWTILEPRPAVRATY